MRFFVKHHSQIQVKLTAILVRPQGNNPVVFWEGEVNAHVTVACENALLKRLFSDPSWEVIAVSIKQISINLLLLGRLAILDTLVVAFLVAFVVAFVIALLVEGELVVILF